jgi:hypothetical protein
MNGTFGASATVCDVCGVAPCETPVFCETSRRAERREIEASRPLMRETPAAEHFPVESLGSLLGDAALAINDRVQAPLAICANSVLAAATLAAQPHGDVVLPIGDHRQKPISAYFVTIAETGERKTECDFQAMWPVRQREQQLRDEYDAKHEAYVNDKMAWVKARESAVKQGKGNREAIRAALDKIGPPPLPPLEPMLTSTEPTYEGLCKQFATHHPGLGIFNSEGGQFIGGHGLNEENRLKTASTMGWRASETCARGRRSGSISRPTR